VASMVPGRQIFEGWAGSDEVASARSRMVWSTGIPAMPESHIRRRARGGWDSALKVAA